MVSITDIPDREVYKKRFLLRTDYNVPLTPNGNIANPFRIDQSVDTILYILENLEGSVVVISHLGRPKGKVVDSLRIEPVRRYLQQRINRVIKYLGGPMLHGEGLKQAQELKSGEIGVLENLRFDPGEEANSKEFVAMLSSLAEWFVHDAFGVVHRHHASTLGLTRVMPSVFGLLMEKEMSALDSIINLKARPALSVLGGAKLSDKLQVVEWFTQKMDTILIGGGMAQPFLCAKYNYRSAICSKDELEKASTILQKHSSKIVIPVDVIATNGEYKHFTTEHLNLSERRFLDNPIADIGKKSVNMYKKHISKAKLIVWNGPMGIVEQSEFAEGTYRTANAISCAGASVKIAGGGSTLEVIDKLKLKESFTHVSTGGGAMLEYLVNGNLLGIDTIRGHRL